MLGNIEAREILSGDVDVVVASGIMGNVALKAIEGTAKLLITSIKAEFKKNIFTKAKVCRMDADTTSKKGSHHKIINDYLNYKNLNMQNLSGENDSIREELKEKKRYL